MPEPSCARGPQARRKAGGPAPDPLGHSLVHERFPALRHALPRLSLGSGPTPVRRLEALSGARAGPDVWVKNDGLYGTLWGGNKARKLEWSLADALRRGRRTVLTVGALATNHGLATTLYAREHGLDTVLLLVDQPIDDHVRRQLRRIEESGAVVHRTHDKLRTLATLPWFLLRYSDRSARRTPYFLTVGGSSPVGCLGYVEAALELGEQVRAGELPEPSHAVIALGSGGTAAGLLLGLRVAGLRTRVVAVLVNDGIRLNARVIAHLARRSERLMRRRGASFPALSLGPGDLTVDTGSLGAGYGHRTREAESARELLVEREELRLEPVYTAKAMAALLRLREEGAFGAGPVLYWHTHNALAPSD